MENEGINRRRFARLKLSLPVRIVTKNADVELLTHDISRHGAFIRTDDPFRERKLLKLAFHLPDGMSLEIMGMVVRRVLPGDEGPTGPGMGIDFFSLSSNTKHTWDKFCQDVDKGVIELPEEFTNVPSASELDLLEEIDLPDDMDDDIEILDEADEIIMEKAPEEEKPPKPSAKIPPIRRKAPRYSTSFLVRMKDKEHMNEFYTRDISTGGMFLKTPMLKEVGDPVEIVVIHPESDQEFSLGATVIRAEESENEEDCGIAIEFDPLTDEELAALKQFIDTGVAFNHPISDALEEQLANMTQAIEMDPENPAVYTALGKMLLEEKESPRKALAELEKALDLQADYLPALRVMAIAYALDGDIESAWKSLRQAVSIEKMEKTA